MNIPRVKDWPAGAAQCDPCGGHGCEVCKNRGWFPPMTKEEKLALTLMLPVQFDPRRRCENPDCRNYIPPDCVAVYCSNDCAASDA